MLKTKLKNLNEINEENISKLNENKIIHEENDLLLPNSSFVQKELNMQKRLK